MRTRNIAVLIALLAATAGGVVVLTRRSADLAPPAVAAAGAPGHASPSGLAPVDEDARMGVRPGGPWDAFIPIRQPQFTSAPEAMLATDDTVLAVEIGGDARAYPTRILDHHEMVIDRVGGIPILGTW